MFKDKVKVTVVALVMVLLMVLSITKVVKVSDAIIQALNDNLHRMRRF